MVPSSPSPDRAHEQAARHPQKAERDLAWMRHACLVFWGVALYYKGYPLGINAVWITYTCGVVYTIVLHWLLRNERRIRTTAMLGTLADSLLTFFICYVTGGLSSIFVPFFYLTVLSGAFRYGVREAIGMLILNGSLVALLFGLRHESWERPELIVLPFIYLGFSTGLGAMLAGWARDNLAIALAQSDALRAERDRSNALLHRLIDTQEEERKQTASDLHDRMGARLFALTHGLEESRRMAGRDTRLQRQLENLSAEAHACGTEVRALMNELRPTVLDELGFYEALSEYLAGLTDAMPFRLDVRLDPNLQKWRSRQDAMLFRLVQEALLNARKHARARCLSVTFGREDHEVMLSVEDDGCGFQTGTIPIGHYGLLTMRERAEVSGGTLQVSSEPGRGTRVIVRFPEGAALS
jgi:two-component system, NarL family, sensor kinase